MEGSGEVVNCLENGSSSEGRPPNPLAAAYRQCFSGPRVAVVAPCKKKSLVRHASLVLCGILVSKMNKITLSSVTCHNVSWIPMKNVVTLHGCNCLTNLTLVAQDLA